MLKPVQWGRGCGREGVPVDMLMNPTDAHWSTDRWVRGSFLVFQQLDVLALRANVRKRGEIAILFK